MTDPVDKTPQKSIKWAIVTLHPWLPERAMQVAGARAWGAKPDMLGTEDVSTTYVDDVRKVRTTNWPSKLPERAALIHALSIWKCPLDQVFFRSPLCVGFSEKHLTETVAAVWSMQAMVYVQTEDVLLRAGDDLAALIEAQTRERKTAEMRVYRAKKPAPKSR
jgi:hypothetical protein